MKKEELAAIVAAINAYMEGEAQPLAVPAGVAPVPVPVASSWRAFGRHEAVRVRGHWHIRRRNR